MFPPILDQLRKCRKRWENASSRFENAVAYHKQQCRLLKVLCDRKQKKRSSHTETAKSFLYRRTLKQMKQKRSSGNVVHLFLQLSILLQQSFEETAPDEEKMALRRTLQPNKNAVISKIKKCSSQLPKSSEKMPCYKKFRTIRTFLRLH